MVDPIGMKPGNAVERRPAPVGPAEPVAATRSVKNATAEPKQAEGAGMLARAMAGEAPVDAERVAKIRKAVQNGTFPLVPSTIADRLLALKMSWNPNDPA